MATTSALVRPCGLRATRLGCRFQSASRPSRSFAVLAKASKPKVAAKSKVVKEPEVATDDVGTAGVAAIAAGLLFNPIVLYSEYTLQTTGAGLPPGPGGLYGAAEGIGYLVVVGIVAWSLYTKTTTGSGLPAGPSGLLGAAEGLSFLSLLGGIVVFGLQIATKGSLPGILG